MCKTVGELGIKRQDLLKAIGDCLSKAEKNLAAYTNAFSIIKNFNQKIDLYTDYGKLVNGLKQVQAQLEKFNTVTISGKKISLDETDSKDYSVQGNKALTNKIIADFKQIAKNHGDAIGEAEVFFGNLKLNRLYFLFLEDTCDKINQLESNIVFCDGYLNSEVALLGSYRSLPLPLQKYAGVKGEVYRIIDSINAVKKNQLYKNVLSDLGSKNQLMSSMTWQTVLENFANRNIYSIEFNNKTLENIETGISQIYDDIQKYDNEKQENQSTTSQPTIPTTTSTLVIGGYSWLIARVKSKQITSVLLNYVYKASDDVEDGSYSKEYILYGSQNMPYQEDSSFWVIHIHWDSGEQNYNWENKATHSVITGSIKRWNRRFEQNEKYAGLQFVGVREFANELKKASKSSFPLGLNQSTWNAGVNSGIYNPVKEEFLYSKYIKKGKGKLPWEERGSLTRETHDDQNGAPQKRTA